LSSRLLFATLARRSAANEAGGDYGEFRFPGAVGFETPNHVVNETVRDFFAPAGSLTIDLEPIAEPHRELSFCRTPLAWRHLPIL
jgi:hypothetical protein